MKKIIVLLILCFLAGCEEQLANPPDFQREFIKLPANSDWVVKYGDSFESQQAGNIVLAVQIINNQGEAIKQLDSRLAALEEATIIDPNRPYFYIDPNSTNIYDTICSKHGRFYSTYVFNDKEYCLICVGEVAIIYLDKHIKGK